jgi:hypothetical protein
MPWKILDEGVGYEEPVPGSGLDGWLESFRVRVHSLPAGHRRTVPGEAVRQEARAAPVSAE